MFNSINIRIFSALIIAVFYFGCVDTSDNNTDPVTTQGSSDGIVQITGETNIEITNTLGGLIVTGESNTGQIRWQLNKSIEAETYDDAQTGLDYFILSTETTGGSIIVSVEFPEGDNYSNIACGLVLGIPYKMNTIINTIAGDAVISYLDTTTTISSVDGDLWLDNHAGSCTINGVPGNADITIALPTNGYCRATDITGDIGLAIPRETSATLSATSPSGIISFSGLTITNLDEQTGHITGTLGTGDGEITITSLSGNISIEGF